MLCSRLIVAFNERSELTYVREFVIRSLRVPLSLRSVGMAIAEICGSTAILSPLFSFVHITVFLLREFEILFFIQNHQSRVRPIWFVIIEYETHYCVIEQFKGDVIQFLAISVIKT